MKKVTREIWARARRIGYGQWRDGRPYLLYMDEDGTTVWGEVIIERTYTVQDFARDVKGSRQ